MKRYIFLGVLIFFIVAGTLPVWSSGKAEKDPEQQESVYVIYHPDKQHVQVLGGKSTHAANGLDRARTRARFMEVRHPADKPKDGTDVVVRKEKKK